MFLIVQKGAYFCSLQYEQNVIPLKTEWKESKVVSPENVSIFKSHIITCINYLKNCRIQLFIFLGSKCC